MYVFDCYLPYLPTYLSFWRIKAYKATSGSRVEAIITYQPNPPPPSRWISLCSNSLFQLLLDTDFKRVIGWRCDDHVRFVRLGYPPILGSIGKVIHKTAPNLCKIRLISIIITQSSTNDQIRRVTNFGAVRKGVTGDRWFTRRGRLQLLWASSRCDNATSGLDEFMQARPKPRSYKSRVQP